MATSGKIRIIAGDWRGRKIDVIDSPGLRPTPDRIRETLFNWLQHDIVGARCLDLFAGAGALAFEALSRGAAEVVMVESSVKIVEGLKKCAEALGSTNHTIQRADALDWLNQADASFDIIFLDPPFEQGYIEQCCVLILEQTLLKPNGLVYIESEKGIILPKGWEVKKKTEAGNVQSLLIKQAT